MSWYELWAARRSRREVLKGAAVAAAAGTALSACANSTANSSSSASAGAAPTTAQNVTTIVWAPWHNVSYDHTLVGLFTEAVQPFLQQNKGLRVQFSPNCCNGGSLVTAELAGNAPDLSTQYNTGTIIANNVALDLMPYVKEYNLNLSNYSAGRISHWQQGGGLYGLPSYTNVYGMIVNTSALDSMGLALPSKQWTYLQAQQTFESATRTVNGKKVAGGAVACHHKGAYMPASFILAGFGAAYVDPTDPARCVADSTEAVAAGNWVFGMLKQGTATDISQCYPKNLMANKTVIDGFGLCSMVEIAAQVKGFEWDFWPMPSLPKGPYTNAGPDSYVIAANSKHPKETFALLNWVVADTVWQTWQMKTLLGAPVLNSLWSEYYTVLRTAAPPLASKDLEVLGSLGEIHIREDFKYNDPAATKILQTYGTDIKSGKMGVSQAFQEMTAQINAMETSEASAAARPAGKSTTAAAKPVTA